MNGTLILDAEEEYDSKSAPLAGLTDILAAFMQIVSGAADIPVTRLLGQLPAGLNATGDGDMKNYHDRIQAIQELDFTPAMSRLDECLIRSATGVRDPDIYYAWAPPEQMSEKEKADMFKTKADAARALFGSASGQEIISRHALSQALVNTFVEDGSLPGLEAAIEEFGGLDQVGQPATVPENNGEHNPASGQTAEKHRRLVVRGHTTINQSRFRPRGIHHEFYRHCHRRGNAADRGRLILWPMPGSLVQVFRAISARRSAGRRCALYGSIDRVRKSFPRIR